MQLFRPDWSPNVATLIRILTILAWLLIVLAVIALIGDALDLLARFRSEVYLFVIGAILAYLMAPVVQLLKRVVRKQWAAVLTAYLLLFAGLVIFAILLINPFISQAGSLVSNLHNPNSTNLASIQIVQRAIGSVQADLEAQQVLLGNHQAISPQQVQQTQSDITTLAREVSGLSPATLPHGAIQIPPSYVTPILAPVTLLRVDYGGFASTPNPTDPARLSSPISDANTAAAQAQATYQKMATTPILLLSLQTLVDNHGIKVDLHDKFGQALQQISSQACLPPRQRSHYHLAGRQSAPQHRPDAADLHLLSQRWQQVYSLARPACAGRLPAGGQPYREQYESDSGQLSPHADPPGAPRRYRRRDRRPRPGDSLC